MYLDYWAFWDNLFIFLSIIFRIRTGYCIDIRFALPATSNVRLTVFNVIGQEIAVLAEGMHSAGVHTVTFDASQLPAGVYFYRLEAGSFSDIRKMLLLK